MTKEEIANKFCENTLMQHLGIIFTKVEEGKIEATMPVTANHTQPMGLLHGGANAALAESVGSLGSAMLVDQKKQAVVGLQISANHLKSVSSGIVTAKGTIIHRGRTTHLWNIDIFDEQQQLLSSCRLTNYIKTI
ncbi:MAG: 1,4-dihydroxy-2-naphthoyl-CoA hydrolase [Flavobacteriales bacterium]|jgi:1,4-dihydroxy-2-naphthoyl-CoA hydrolase